MARRTVRLFGKLYPSWDRWEAVDAFMAGVIPDPQTVIYSVTTSTLETEGDSLAMLRRKCGSQRPSQLRMIRQSGDGLTLEFVYFSPFEQDMRVVSSDLGRVDAIAERFKREVAGPYGAWQVMRRSGLVVGILIGVVASLIAAAILQIFVN